MFPTRIERTGTAAAEVEAGAVLGASPATLAEQRRIRADRTYLLGAGLLAESLGVDTTYGLTDAQVNMRREEYGPNRLTEQRPAPDGRLSATSCAAVCSSSCSPRPSWPRWSSSSHGTWRPRLLSRLAVSLAPTAAHDHPQKQRTHLPRRVRHFAACGAVHAGEGCVVVTDEPQVAMVKGTRPT